MPPHFLSKQDLCYEARLLPVKLECWIINEYEPFYVLGVCPSMITTQGTESALPARLQF